MFKYISNRMEVEDIVECELMLFHMCWDSMLWG